LITIDRERSKKKKKIHGKGENYQTKFGANTNPQEKDNSFSESTNLYRQQQTGEPTSEGRTRNRYNFTRNSARSRSSSITRCIPSMEHSAVVLRRELKGRKGEEEEELKGWELTCAVALGLRHRASTPELRRRRLLSSRVLGPGWRLALLSGVVRP